jgi:glycosyltransferase involved in cell wall biosynthesis
MDIAFINRMIGITRGGGEIWDLKMAEHLQSKGVNVTFYVGKPLFGDLSNPVREFDSVTVPTPHLQDTAYAAPKGVGGILADIDAEVFCRRAARELQERNHDLVQVCSRPEFGRYIDTVDAPVSVVMHGEPYSLWQDYVNPLSSSYDFFDEFDAVIATGMTTGKIEERTGIDVHTINPGVDTDTFAPDDEGTAGKTVLFVGRFVPAKNLPALIETFDAVHDSHPESELVLVGDGPRRAKVERKIKVLGLNDAVRLPGYIGHEDLPRFYRQADVFALSSRHESFGMVLLEALSCGVPVVAPEIDWIPNIVDHGRDGLLWATREEFETYLERLLSDSDLRGEFGESGRKRAVDRFDWDSRAQQLAAIYNSPITEESRSKPDSSHNQD